MTEKRRRDEPQSGLPNGGPGLQAEPCAQIDRHGAIHNSRRRLHRTDLGEQRSGSGVVIRESGLVLTIGYLDNGGRERLVADAEGRVTPAHPLAIDTELASAWSRRWAISNARRSSSATLERSEVGDPVTVAAGAATTTGARNDCRQAGIRRLLGIFSRRGDLHLARPSVLGRRRRDRRGGPAPRHRLVACRATQRARAARATST